MAERLKFLSQEENLIRAHAWLEGCRSANWRADGHVRRGTATHPELAHLRKYNDAYVPLTDVFKSLTKPLGSTPLPADHCSIALPIPHCSLLSLSLAYKATDQTSSRSIRATFVQALGYLHA